MKLISDKIKKRLNDIKEDLLDDGKLNYSNNPDKKSPGRKKGGENKMANKKIEVSRVTVNKKIIEAENYYWICAGCNRNICSPEGKIKGLKCPKCKTLAV